jgi:hypothetical protein
MKKHSAGIQPKQIKVASKYSGDYFLPSDAIPTDCRKNQINK